MVAERVDSVDAIAQRIDLSASARTHFCTRDCRCLFLLEEHFRRFCDAKHIRGRGAGKPNNTRRNELLRGLFDVNGNLSFERLCVLSLFGVSSGRPDRVHKQARVGTLLRLVPKDKLTNREYDYIQVPPEARNAAVAWFNRLQPQDLVELVAGAPA